MSLPREIDVFSADYDGSFSQKRFNSTDIDILISENDKLLKYVIATRTNKKRPIILMVGSNRQDHSRNRFCADTNKNGCCFRAMEQLANHPRYRKIFSLDKYLLADTDNHLPAGTCFDEARKWGKTHFKFIGDEYKIRLLYAQMHRIASQYPNARIRFIFSDDRLDILNLVNNFFYVLHPELRPHNVDLYCLPWSERDRSLRERPKEISPGGEIDFNYEKNIRTMAHLCKIPNGYKKNEMLIHYLIHNCHGYTVNDFTNQRDMRRPNNSLDEHKEETAAQKALALEKNQINFLIYSKQRELGLGLLENTSLPAQLGRARLWKNALHQHICDFRSLEEALLLIHPGNRFRLLVELGFEHIESMLPRVPNYQAALADLFQYFPKDDRLPILNKLSTTSLYHYLKYHGEENAADFIKRQHYQEKLNSLDVNQLSDKKNIGILLSRFGSDQNFLVAYFTTLWEKVSFEHTLHVVDQLKKATMTAAEFGNVYKQSLRALMIVYNNQRQKEKNERPFLACGFFGYYSKEVKLEAVNGYLDHGTLLNDAIRKGRLGEIFKRLEQHEKNNKAPLTQNAFNH